MPSQPTRVVVTETRTVETTASPAQVDPTPELRARGAQLRPALYLALALIAFGIFAFTPWGKNLLGSTTTAALFIAGGAALLVLSTLLYQHAVWVGLALLAVLLLYFFAHRHGQLKEKSDHATVK